MGFSVGQNYVRTSGIISMSIVFVSLFSLPEEGDRSFILQVQAR